MRKMLNMENDHDPVVLCFGVCLKTLFLFCFFENFLKKIIFKSQPNST